MARKEIFEAISAERDYQDGVWGTKFDDKNTPNDWATFLTQYAGKVAPLQMETEVYRKNLVKVAAIAVAALEALERTGAPVKRHYDQ